MKPLDDFQILEEAKTSLEMETTDTKYISVLYLTLRTLCPLKRAIKLTLTEKNLHNLSISYKDFLSSVENAKVDKDVLKEYNSTINNLNKIIQNIKQKPITNLGNLLWIEALAKKPRTKKEFESYLNSAKNEFLKREK